VSEFGTVLHPEVKVIHDVSTGKGVPYGDGGVKNLSALVEIDQVGPETAGTEVECYSIICHNCLWNYVYKKDMKWITKHRIVHRFDKLCDEQTSVWIIEKIDGKKVEKVS
jgi:hypothetical protein